MLLEIKLNKMTNERMQEIAAEIVADLEISQAGEFAGILREALENAPYNPEQMEELDAKLYAAGVDVNPVCRKKHPPAP